ncbi:hypothetical protein B0O99DRAFT_680164 [Bisporella sp. PMI_857]|nr:hypothetical protein B0O99DRAFT_680164 [Bisporella sp. PMI_857]
MKTEALNQAKRLSDLMRKLKILPAPVPSTFYPFPNLPFELQALVWQIAILSAAPQVLEIWSHLNGDSNPTYFTAIPVWFHLCKAARNAAQQVYAVSHKDKNIRDFQYLPPQILIRPTDTVLLFGQARSYSFFFDGLQSDREKVRHLAMTDTAFKELFLTEDDFLLFGHITMELSKHISNMEHKLIVIPGGVRTAMAIPVPWINLRDRHAKPHRRLKRVRPQNFRISDQNAKKVKMIWYYQKYYYVCARIETTWWWWGSLELHLDWEKISIWENDLDGWTVVRGYIVRRTLRVATEPL